MTLRELNVGDIPALREICRESFAELWEPEHFRSLIQHAHRVAWGLWGERGLMGYFFGLKVVDELDVVTVAVHPDYRRQGVGEKLIARGLEGVRRATLEVAESNEAARRLYGKMGFVESGRRPRYYRGEEDGILMVWESPTE